MKKLILKCFIVVVLLIVAITPTLLAASLGGRTLKVGSRGNDVYELQQKLNELGFWAGNPDGVFGNKTKNAVKKFQASKGLKADGIVGTSTLKVLNKYSNTSSYRGTVSRFSSRDIELLAKLVSAEARGEPYLGKVAVAATVLNRLNDPRYPNSISEIIFQVEGGRYQYSPVQDGQIYLSPDETSRKAVIDAMSGYDPTGGATIFYNPQKTSDSWVRSKTYITTIGNHIFSK
jgi:N-acetylmuramoyl-L-alanine amidase